MIVLDTNVLSEVLRPQPDSRVLAWITAQPITALFTTTLTRAEILYGVLLLPKSRRREKLQAAVNGIFNEDFPDRVLAFDDSAAAVFAEIAVHRRSVGRPISQVDAMIARCRAGHAQRQGFRGLWPHSCRPLEGVTGGK